MQDFACGFGEMIIIHYLDEGDVNGELRSAGIFRGSGRHLSMVRFKEKGATDIQLPTSNHY